MFDNLRQQSQQSDQPEEEAGSMMSEAASAGSGSPGSLRMSASTPSLVQGVLAMSPMQRFILALMLFLNVTVLGCFALLAFERVALPF